MIRDEKRVQLARFDSNTRNILGRFAVGDKAYNRRDIHALSGKAGWRGKRGRKLSSKEVGDIVNALLERDFLEHDSYSSVRIVKDIQDLVVQDAVRNENFTTLSDIVKEGVSTWYSSERRPRCDQRIAFYSGDAATFLTNASRQKEYGSLGLLRPFSRDIFDGLPDELKEW